MNHTELSALLRLLDDPDKEVYSVVKQELLNCGQEIVPQLENIWEENFDTLIQERAEDIIQKIHFNKIKSKFKNWIKSEKKDLLIAWHIISKSVYPDIKILDFKYKINQMAKSLSLKLTDDLNSIEKTIILNNVFFQENGFRGKFKNVHAPQSFLISDVINNKKGSPLCLSILYILVAQKCQIPICGINLPHHFIVACEKMNFEADQVEFYINTFNKGKIINRKEIESFLIKQNIALKSKYFTPCGNKEIIKRLLYNLYHTYSKDKIDEKAQMFSELINLLEKPI